MLGDLLDTLRDATLEPPPAPSAVPGLRVQSPKDTRLAIASPDDEPAAPAPALALAAPSLPGSSTSPSPFSDAVDDTTATAIYPSIDRTRPQPVGSAPAKRPVAAASRPAPSEQWVMRDTTDDERDSDRLAARWKTFLLILTMLTPMAFIVLCFSLALLRSTYTLANP
jgi:hypothetical protein